MTEIKEISIRAVMCNLLKTKFAELDIWKEIESDIAMFCSGLPYEVSDSKKDHLVKVIKNIKAFLLEKKIPPANLRFLDEIIEKFECSIDGAIQMLKEETGIKNQILENKDSFKILKLDGIGIFKVQSPRFLKETKLLYEAISFDNPLSYKLYEFKFGVGQNPQFLITNPNVRIQNGENEKYICPSSISEEDDIYNNFPSGTVVKYLAKCLGIESKDGTPQKEKPRDKLWEEILSLEPLFFKPNSPLSKESLEKLKTSDNETLNKIIDCYLEERNNLDKRLLLIAKSQFLDYDGDIAKPEHLMPYSPHAVIVTNTKTGKTSIYGKIGEKRERMSMAGALGFSTGNETNEGDLNGVMGSYAVDEVQESTQANVIQQTLTAMETGKVAISVGKQTVRTDTCAILTFLTNPKELSKLPSSFDPQRISLGAFRRVCEILTDNYGAFGSRIGMILFGNDFIRVRGSRLDYKTLESDNVNNENQQIKEILALDPSEIEEAVLKFENPIESQKKLAVMIKYFLDHQMKREINEKGFLSDSTRRWVESYSNILEKIQKALHGDKHVTLNLHRVTHSQIAAKMREVREED